jgi:mannose-6-phosphate isomerase-like protein (cupin superfamily)
MEKKFDVIEYLESKKLEDPDYINHLEFFIKESNKYQDFKSISFLEKKNENFGYIEKSNNDDKKITKIFLDHNKLLVDGSESFYSKKNSYGLRKSIEDLSWYVVEGMGFLTYNNEKRAILEGEMINIPKGTLYDIEIDNIRRGPEVLSSITIIEEANNENHSIVVDEENNAKLSLTRDPAKILKKLKIEWSDIFNKYNLPEELKDSPLKNLGAKYKDIIEPHYPAIKKIFDEKDRRYLRVKGLDKEGVPYKFELNDEGKELLRPLIDFFRKEFNIEDDLDKVIKDTQCVRNDKTDIPDIDEIDLEYFYQKRDLPEWWHLDTTSENMFRIGIYFTDVTENTAPFTYLQNPEANYFFIEGVYDEMWTNGKFKTEIDRINYFKRYIEYGFMKYSFKKENLISITGPAFTTFLFAPNFLHRSTYARAAYRDVLFFQFFTKSRDK